MVFMATCILTFQLMQWNPQSVLVCLTLHPPKQIMSQMTGRQLWTTTNFSSISLPNMMNLGKMTSISRK